MKRKISVFLIDDSALVRELTASVLEREPDIELAGSAPDAFSAEFKLRSTSPDVILLDIEMPGVDGLRFLQTLKRTPHTANIPVLMFSSLTTSGCDQTLKALERGAIDFVTKPKLDLRRGFESLTGDLCHKIRAAAHSQRFPPGAARAASSAASATSTLLRSKPNATLVTPPPQAGHVELIVIGCSTGGTEALREIFGSLPAELPPIAIVQHMPERFTAAFAKRLDQTGAVRVKEAEDGDKLLPGNAYLAPGNTHLEIQRAAGFLRARIVSGRPAVNGHRPSVDVLFESCARLSGTKMFAVLLTGMGADGAHGLLKLRHAGAHTIAQDETTSVVFGMPREAIELGAAIDVLPLPMIVQHLAALQSVPQSPAARVAQDGPTEPVIL